MDTATKNLRWFCDSVVGAGKAGTRCCTKGSECRSGVCAAAGVCFDACQQNQDCFTLGAPTQLTCKSLEITVEGVTVTQKGCG